MTNKQKVILVSLLGTVCVGLVATVVYLIRLQHQTEVEMSEMVEQMTYEKEQLEEEYADVALEMEGFSYKVDNDSLLSLIEKEQNRVQNLLEELRTVKATNARRISELKKELASVRKVLVYYVAQVDSLSAVNMELTTENRQVKERYNAVTREAETLAQEKQQLTEKVIIASQLEAKDILVELQNQRGRKTNSVRKLAVIKVSYTLLKNITAKVGNKTIYMRIATPDGGVLQKNISDKFLFEDKNIAYSARKSIEYDGEELIDVIYYTVTETLWEGNYRVDLFVDEHLVGTESFVLKK